MYDDIELLEYIYQSVRINQETIGQIIKQNNIVDRLNEELKNHLKNYSKIINSSKVMLQRRKKDVNDIGIISKMVTYMSVKSNSGNSLEEIVALVIQGSKIEISEITKRLKEFKIKSKSIINLAERLIIFEKEIINVLEKSI